MKPLLSLTIGVFVSFFGLTAAGWAQTTPAAQPSASASAAPAVTEQQPFFLTLSEAIELSLAQNHDILLAQTKIEDARLQLTETGAQGLPQLTASASYGRQDPIASQQSTDTSGAGGGAGLGSNPQFAAFLGTASVNTFQTNITLNQTLFAGFRIVDGVRLANINIDLVEQGVRQARQNVAYQVTNAYFNALRAAEVVELDKQTLAQTQEQVRVAESRLKAGTGVKLDVLTPMRSQKWLSIRRLGVTPTTRFFLTPLPRWPLLNWMKTTVCKKRWKTVQICSNCAYRRK